MMYLRLNGIICLLVTCIPFPRVRMYALQIIHGFSICKKSKIGFCNYISIERLEMHDAVIGSFNWIHAESLVMTNGSFVGRFNRIKNVNLISLGNEAIIQAWNRIFAPKSESVELKESEFVFSEQNLILGDKSELLRMNYVDLTRSLILGNNVVIGGSGSEFWTHGFDVQRNMKLGSIIISDNVFVGSQCIFNPGLSIAADVIIAPGTVVYKNISISGMYSSHSLVLVKKIT